MNTSNYLVKPATADGLNYTLTKGTALYQKTVEIRERILFKSVENTVPIYKFFFKPKKSGWQVTEADLMQYQEGTLARDWAAFYENEPFSITNNYERHDICHVILGYKTSIVEETKMYAFLYGMGKRSLPTLLTILIGSLFFPEFAKEFYQDYKKGKQVHNFLDWDFRYLLGEKTETLRQIIFKQKIEETPLFI